jgi:hypothetical protein
MKRDISETHTDVLQNIEFGIIQVYRADKSLLDIDVKDAVDALVRHYHAEEEQRNPPVRRLGDRAQRVFSSAQAACEFRLGRALGPGETELEKSTVPVAVVVECLRKIQKSVPRWSQQSGRQGYLKFIGPFLP